MRRRTAEERRETMEIGPGALVVNLDTGTLVIVQEKVHNRRLWRATIRGNTLFVREEMMIPLVQTDGDTEDPKAALREHLSEVIVALARRQHELEKRMQELESGPPPAGPSRYV